MKIEEKILGKNSLFELLAELEAYRSDYSDVLTIYIAPGSLPEIPEVFNDIIERIRRSTTGAIIFSWKLKEKNILVFPPFPVRDERFLDKKFRTHQLRERLEKKYLLGVILLRLGEYALGVFEGDKLLASKCGKRLVRAKHRKGGYSQARFRRIREAQIDKFFNEVYQALRKKFDPWTKKFDYILYGGTKITIKKFQKRDDWLKKLSENFLDKSLDVQKINKESLENILKEVWRTKVLTL
jgi:peptide subunit release factor 1 (eRF1)